jgi:nicotinamide phosphoribosyltransferase
MCRQLHEMWNECFFSRDWTDVKEELEYVLDSYLGKGAIDLTHFQELHQLGYLPIIIKALPEGSLVNIKVPLFTIRNTNPRFAWLTNYLETWLSATIWKKTTIATIIREYRKLVNAFALKTTGSIAGTEFQIHDFSYRGLSDGDIDPAGSGAGFLTSSCGSDNIPSLPYIAHYYNTDLAKEFIGTSVPASEHSLASTGIAVNGELETYRKWITKDYPTGIVSIIADTLDFFRVVTEFATELKDDILNRKPNALGLAKVVFRPDSGCPVKILTGYKQDEITLEADGTMTCNNTGRKLSSAEIKGAVQCLWEIFGGSVTAQGFKVLHERVGLIYGDSITLERAKLILQRLKDNGFASTNVVFGVGSYTCQYLTRDSLGMAIKATAATVNGVLHALSKDPVTDDGTKKSAKGLLRVEKQGDDFVLYDQQTWDEEAQGELKPIFIDGVFPDKTVTFQEVRQRIWG